MDILMAILRLILMIVIPAALSYGTYLVGKYVNKVFSNIEDAKSQEMIEEGLQIIEDSVNCVQQTYVDSLKKAGEFTQEAQKEALNKAKENALQLMNEKIKETIANNYGDITLFIITVIESIIQSKK